MCGFESHGGHFRRIGPERRTGSRLLTGRPRKGSASSSLASSALEDSPSLTYGADLESQLGLVPRAFKSHILRSGEVSQVRTNGSRPENGKGTSRAGSSPALSAQYVGADPAGRRR